MSRTITCAFIVGLLLLESRKCSSLDDPYDTVWWETALVYEIWPASYQDSNGDGIGDLQGIINRLDYVKDLGVDIVCLNPIYQSPFVDSGFDVSDHRMVNPVFGDLNDFDRLINETHARDIKLVLDFVPSHTSDEHPWFEASKRMEEPYTDYYVWANGTLTENGTRLPPDNRVSIWNDTKKSAWTYNDDRKQWYYHTFHEREPDLNLEQPSVRNEIMNLLQFWSNRRVDGFRITGTPHSSDEQSPLEEEMTRGLPENVQLLSDIRNGVDVWSAILGAQFKHLTAASPDTAKNLLPYLSNPSTNDAMPSDHYLIRSDAITDTDASELQNAMRDWLNSIQPNASTNSMLPSRDSTRITSRIHSDRLDAFAMFNMLLPGQAYTYFGDEIGMQDAPSSSKIVHEEAADGRKPYDHIYSYENLVRSPMQWDDSSPSAGFTTKAIPLFNPPNPDYVRVNVAKQLAEPRSHLNIYKRLAKLRKSPVFRNGDWELETMNDDGVLVLRRTLSGHPVHLAIANLADTMQTINMTELYPETNEYLDVLVTSDTRHAEGNILARDNFALSPDAGLVLRSAQNDESDSTEREDGDEGESAATATAEREEKSMDGAEREDEAGEETDVTEENREPTEGEGKEEAGDEKEQEEKEAREKWAGKEVENATESTTDHSMPSPEDNLGRDRSEVSTVRNDHPRGMHASVAEYRANDESDEGTNTASDEVRSSSCNESPLASTSFVVGIIFVHAVLIKVW